jgi:DedD protein
VLPPPVADAAPSPVAPPPVITEREADQGREVPPAGTTATAASQHSRSMAAASAPRPVVAAASAAKPVPAPAPAAVAPAASPRSADDGRRAQALLEGQSAAKASDSASGRMVVQVGAYTDADKLREARQKVEKLGLKTYTQVVEADGARRTRVRVGPFATRDEADKAASRIKAAGLPVAVLSL